MYISSRLAHRGAPSGGVRLAERGAVPAGRLATCTRATRGSAWRPLRAARRESADRDDASRPGKRGPGSTRSRGGAPRGAPAGVIGRLISGLTRGDRPYREAGHGCGASAPAPVGALPPSIGGHKTTAPPAPQKNRGGGALAIFGGQGPDDRGRTSALVLLH